MCYLMAFSGVLYLVMVFLMVTFFFPVCIFILRFPWHRVDLINVFIMHFIQYKEHFSVLERTHLFVKETEFCSYPCKHCICCFFSSWCHILGKQHSTGTQKTWVWNFWLLACCVKSGRWCNFSHCWCQSSSKFSGGEILKNEMLGETSNLQQW